MAAIPLLSDIHPTQIKFQAGDRVLVRVSVQLNKDQYLNIERAVKKFAQVDVNVLIVDCTRVRMLWNEKRLVGPEDTLGEGGIELRVAHLDCSVVDFKSQDRLTVSIPHLISDLQRKSIQEHIQRWTGKDVEVIIQEEKS